MDPSILIPTPDAIPVPAGWFKFFLMLTFMVHILLVNAMLGTGFIALFSRMKGNADSLQTEALEKDVSERLTFIIAFAVNFGVAPLLFLQVLYGQFIYVSSQLMAVYWLSVVGLLIIAYYSAYYYKFGFDTLANRAYPIGVTVVILLFIGFLFTNNMTLMLTPDAWVNYFDNPKGTFLNLTEPTLLPRYLHFMIASVAIGGLFIAVIWHFKEKKGVPHARQNMQRGMKWFLHATVIQIVVGFWFQMSLPKEILLQFMGESKPHTILFLLSMASVVPVIIFSMKEKVIPTVASVLVLVFFMIMMRDMVRTAYLKPFFEISHLEVFHQYSPLICFLISLSIGLGVVIYLIRLAMKSDETLTS